MTEEEWRTARHPDTILYHAGRRPRKRKRRLFACACCRRVWEWMADERSRAAVECAEGFADGAAGEGERASAHAAARQAVADAHSLLRRLIEAGAGYDQAKRRWSASQAARQAIAAEKVTDAARDAAY